MTAPRRWCALALALVAAAGCRRPATTSALDDSSPPSPAPETVATPSPEGGTRWGAFVPTQGEAQSEGDEVRRGIELALGNAQRADSTREVDVVARGGERPWGAGTGEVVRLFFEDGVTAVIGGLRGEAAHLAEQMAVKAQLPLITPWAQERSVAQANVPWLFRLVPNDRQQARAMASALRGRRCVVLVEDSFDAMAAARELRRAADSSFSEVSLTDPDAAEDTVRRRPEMLILLGRSPKSVRVLGDLAARLPKTQVLASLNGMTADGLRELGSTAPRVRVVWTEEGADSSTRLRDFVARYTARQGSRPSPLAAYSHDAATALLRAGWHAGEEPRELAARVRAVSFDGVTGRVAFSRSGDRKAPVPVLGSLTAFVAPGTSP